MLREKPWRRKARSVFALQRSESWVLGSPRESQKGWRSRTWGSEVSIPEEAGAGLSSWGMVGRTEGSGSGGELEGMLGSLKGDGRRAGGYMSRRAGECLPTR